MTDDTLPMTDEPVFHLRSYGDVSRADLDALASPAAPHPAQKEPNDTTHNSEPLLEGDSWVVTHSANGHAGPGWYAHDPEYPDEGAVFIAAAPAIPAQQAGQPEDAKDAAAMAQYFRLFRTCGHRWHNGQPLHLAAADLLDKFAAMSSPTAKKGEA